MYEQIEINYSVFWLTKTDDQVINYGALCLTETIKLEHIFKLVTNSWLNINNIKLYWARPCQRRFAASALAMIVTQIG